MNTEQICRFQFTRIELCHVCVLSVRSFIESAEGKFVFTGSALRLSGSDIFATHNPLREELAVNNISPGDGLGLGFTPCYSN